MPEEGGGEYGEVLCFVIQGRGGGRGEATSHVLHNTESILKYQISK